MGHGVESKFGDSRGDMLRMAELYANISLTDIFANGAAVSSQGVLAYPFFDDRTLDSGNKELFNEGHIVSVRPEEAVVDVKSSSNPPIIFIIPPRSLDRLALQRSFSRGREHQPSVSLYFGIGQNNMPIVDSVTANHKLMDYLKNIALKNIQNHGIDTGKLDAAPKTIAKNALFDMANEFGIGDLDIQVKKDVEEKERDNGELILDVEEFLNGNHDK